MPISSGQSDRHAMADFEVFIDLDGRTRRARAFEHGVNRALTL
jgi:hypothetical protein